MTDTTVITRATDATTVTTADAITVYGTTEATTVVGTGNAGPAGGGGAVYSYNFVSSADDRALWVPFGSTRKTYGNLTDEDARTVLGCTVAQHSVPPTSFATTNSTFVVWNGPTINVSEGDLLDIVAVLRWDATANSLDPIESDSTTGYSQAYDRNGNAVRAYTTLQVDSNFVQDANTEPSFRPVAGWLRTGLWVATKGSAIAAADGTVAPAVNVGAFWSNVAGTVMVSGVVVVVTSRNQ
jgi:hypothetical protein